APVLAQPAGPTFSLSDAGLNGRLPTPLVGGAPVNRLLRSEPCRHLTARNRGDRRSDATTTNSGYSTMPITNRKHFHRPVRILIVEDYPDAADSLALLLTLHGYAVRVAHDG